MTLDGSHRSNRACQTTGHRCRSPGLHCWVVSSPAMCTPIPPTMRWQSSMSSPGRPSRPPRRCTPRSWIWARSWKSRQAADKQHADDQASVDLGARPSWPRSRPSVDKVAAAMYMGGRTDGMNAILTAESPQGLIDKLAVQRVMATEMSAQMTNYQQLSAAAAAAEAAVREVGRRRQDRRRAGCRGACRPAVQAEPAAVADRRREVAVHGAHARTSGWRSPRPHRCRAGPARPRRAGRRPGCPCAPRDCRRGDIAPPEAAVTRARRHG